MNNKIKDLKNIINKDTNTKNNKTNTNIIILDNNNFNNSLFEYLSNLKSLKVDLIDKTNNYYITLKIKGTNKSVEVPFNYIIINTNKKLNGIPYINNEVSCSCKKLNLCNISDNCYSLRDQKRFKNNNYKIVLNVIFWNHIKKDNNLYNIVVEYLKQFKLIRFNCNNDFKDFNDILFLNKLSHDLINYSIVAGYTKRTDLIKNLNNIKRCSNFIINGSNYMIDNNFYVTTNLKKYIEYNYTCLGSCKNCLKCYNKNNKLILCLLHGTLSNIDKYFNNKDNRDYLIQIFNKYDIKLTHDILTTNKGLLSSLNKYFKNNNIDLKIKNYKELLLIIETTLK